MGLITERAGRVYIRVGGNSQETASLVDSLPGGVAMSKDKTDSSNPVGLVSTIRLSITFDLPMYDNRQKHRPYC